MEYVISQTLFARFLKIVSISTVSSWQREMYMLTVSDNPTYIQNPEPAQIFPSILLHPIWPSFPHHGYLVRFCVAQKITPSRDQVF